MNDVLSFCTACANKMGYVLQEFSSPVYDSFGNPISKPTYRLVDSTNGIIKTYGTIDVIKSYFTSHL